MLMQPLRVIFLSAALVATNCKAAPSQATSRACEEAVSRGRSLLAVPDYGAARDWLAQAEKICGADAKRDVDTLAGEIDAAERQRALAEEERKRAPAPKPAAESLVPEVVALALAYRDDKTRRTTCDQQPDEDPPICESTRRGAHIQVNVATVKKDPAAYSVFASLSRELVDCSALGPHEVKRTWKHGGAQEQYCLMKGGPLTSMMVFIDQRLGVPESNVTIFSTAWGKYDTDLSGRLVQGSDL
jgi:hypothetical protein